MVTTKRQINTEKDRFGNFRSESRRSPFMYDSVKTDLIDTPSADEYVPHSSIVISDPDYTTVSNREGSQPVAAEAETEKTVRAPAEQPLYTTLETYGSVKQQKPAAAAHPVKERKSHEREDIMPSIKTRAYVSETPKVDIAPQAQRRERKALEPRQKVLLTIYVAIAIALAVAVIATGVSISGTQARITEITEQIAQKQVVLAEQEQTIALLTNEATIRDAAVANGMVSTDKAVYTASRVDKVIYPQAEPHTNSFDEFCNWLSKIVG